MVRLLFLIVTALFIPATLSAAQLKVKPATDQIEMGKSLKVEIYYEGDTAPGQANLNKWRGDFFIDHVNVETLHLPTGVIQTIEKLRLYPRHAGSNTLHSIALGGAISKPVKIQVQASIRNNIDGTPEWSALPANIWQGESVKTCVNTKLFDPGNTIKIDEIDLPGFSVNAYPSEKYTVEGVSHLRQCWSIFGLIDGIHKLSLPAITQRGRGRWKYYLPFQSLEILPLPSYLPPTVPVGKPLLETKLIAENNNAYWQMVATIDDNFTSEIYGIRSALASIANIPVDEVSFETISTDNNLKQQQIFKAPLPSWLWGYGKGPEISVRYFDTDKGILGEQDINLPPEWRFANWFLFILLIASGIVFLYLSKRAYRLARMLLWRLTLRKFILQANNAHQLRQVILTKGCFNPNDSTFEFKTLQQWAETTGDEKAIEIAKRLNRYCFSVIQEDHFKEIQAILGRFNFSSFVRFG